MTGHTAHTGVDSNALGETDRDRFSGLPARQQPDWPDREALRETLAALPPEDLVSRASVAELKRELANLDAGGGLILQLGDCVENIETDVNANTRNMIAFLTHFRSHLRTRTGRHVVGVGRLAGQYAKPRSQDHETVDGMTLPSFRGPIVNSHHPTPQARRPSPHRVALAHAAAQTSYAAIADYHRATAHLDPIWTSHEMLLLDYELRYLRRSEGDGHHLATAHWPWIGARTRQLDGAHIAVAATLSNPVSVKIGPDTAPDEAAELAAVLNPRDEPGKLTFIARLGHQKTDRLGPIVRGVHRRVEHVHWISDPMHGNTVQGAHGFKTRHVEHIIAELTRFQEIVVANGRRPAGLHLEATPEDVYECTENSHEPQDPARYRTLLDPRLNPEQTARVLSHWSV
ncbi:3-deoxy-7-phosphoheptulonate synthase [Streptomyces albipurpureus]|uniref:Phospho-2-dehydro-3-deoxyheptonate aldolase n=1 Tax=Streptomyces albipurpureus TaxID=2897419 RepID=A0ABT0UYW9_9ACTN|nr:3-deoxy-7-phosphoheptulonate synthase [Streptomyces sp. CWNU-1]MCM2393674.1 3-deoxy-7-phosphoheptulonate synthase [Streptomyces sp. CWNU-1]